MSTFEFQLKDPVAIVVSGESGSVVGRAEYATPENSYLVHYKAADGKAVDSWWGESALAAARFPSVGRFGDRLPGSRALSGSASSRRGGSK